MKISFWIDYNCPYSYIGYTRLNKTITELNINDVKYDVHAFEIQQQENKTYTENLKNKYENNIQQINKEKNMLTKLAAQEEIPLNMDSTIMTPSRNAHRITKLAIQSNNQQTIKTTIKNLFESRFNDNEDISDNKILLKIAIQSGLDVEETQEVLNTEKFNTEVILDKRVAEDTNIWGVPYFIFNNKYPIPGILPENELKNVIRKVKFEEDFAEKVQSQKH